MPLVFTSINDPVASGFVTSLARPGGNMTGLTILGPELSGKRLELLKESFPNVKRVAVFWNPDAEVNVFNSTQAAASTLGLQLQSLGVRGANDFDSAFEAAIREHIQALLTIATPILNFHQGRIIKFAAKNRLPAMYALPEFTDAGGLMSYSPNYIYCLVPPNSMVCGQGTQRYKTSRFTRGTTYEVRVHRQFKNLEGARADDSAKCSGKSRPSPQVRKHNGQNPIKDLSLTRISKPSKVSTFLPSALPAPPCCPSAKRRT